MDYEFAAARESNGPLLSPAHASHLDSFTKLRNLRRSLSKSPSKVNFRRSRSPSSSPSSHFPRFPAVSPSGIHSAQSLITTTTAHQFETACPPSAKKLRPSLRRHTPLRIHTCPTPTRVRRALSSASDHGNGSPHVHTRSKSRGEGTENLLCSISPAAARRWDASQESKSYPLFKLHDEGFHSLKNQQQTPSTTMKIRRPSKTSPLNDDGHKNIQQMDHGSPSMKRKSVSGGFSSSPFDISNTAALTSGGIHVDEAFDSDDDGAMTKENMFCSPLPPKYLNPRKSAAPLRSIERPGVFRARRSIDGGIEGSKSPRPQPDGRPRFSLDSAMALSDNTEPTTNTLDTSQPFEDALRASHGNHIRQHMNTHPLSQSQALSPTLASPLVHRDTGRSGKPVFAVPPVPVTNFARSLPIGALRPAQRTLALKQPEQSMATPEAYKIARPDPAAFRSTGLISKRYRNPDNLPAPPGQKTGMPDTPCKKIPSGFSMPFSPSPVHTVVKSRFAQPQFGTPSRPFNPHASQSSPLTLGTSAGVFGSSFQQASAKRKESFNSMTSFDGEDTIQSPTAPNDSQSSADELPPTPTKQATGAPAPKQNSLRSSLLGRRPSVGPHTFAPPEQTELEPSQPQALFLLPPKPWISTKSMPQTPADGAFPDPSNLSISPRSSNPLSPSLYPAFTRNPGPPPETPTHRDAMPAIANPLVTPSNHGNTAMDVDPVLNARFKRVVWFDKGEFSEVYKVFQPADSPGSRSYFSPNTRLNSSQTSRPDNVWVVKKSLKPYTSAKIRTRRLEEVAIMKNLGKHDHVVELIDSFEAHCHLYIQMEYCEEGSLDRFLANQGTQGRLDDFRIWKILIELCEGIKHIHDSGIMHLDLKPANVFIDYEGVLKIGDFGMALRWPAPIFAENEGDRRYIGQDLLEGRFDKPADIFSIGMIMVEIAMNVIPPDNGSSWQKLRSGDWSEVGNLTAPSLTNGSSVSMLRDSQHDLSTSQSTNDEVKSQESVYLPGETHHTTASADTMKKIHLPVYDDEGVTPPKFMIDAKDMAGLDLLVHWMMTPTPEDRPVVDQVLAAEGVLWVTARRRAGAVVFEGKYGPSDHVLKDDDIEDEEMVDGI